MRNQEPMRGPDPQEEPASELILRRMRLDDIPTIYEIEREAFTLPWSLDAFYNELRHNRYAIYMVGEYQQEVIAYGGMWLVAGEAHITNVAVREAFRGRKYGEQLMREMQKVAAYLGGRRMTLEVRRSNEIAQKLYRKLGFNDEGYRRKYYTDNQEDALIMWAELDMLEME